MKMKCPICDEYYDRIEAHICTHDLKVREFYDEYILENNDDICDYCEENKTNFISINKGYKKYCSHCNQSKEVKMKKYN